MSQREPTRAPITCRQPHDGTARKIIGQLNPEDLMGNGLYQNPDDNTLRERADSPASLTLLPCKQVEPPPISGDPMSDWVTGDSWHTLSCITTTICPIKAVINGGWILCSTRVFPENEWTLRSANIGCEYEIVHWG
jgi:hypothetical protein